MQTIRAARAVAVLRSGSSPGVLAAAGLTAALALLIAYPAAAEEPAEMKVENQVLRERIENLSQELRILKNMVVQNQQAVAEVSARPEPRKPVTSGKETVSLKVSGQISRMALYADDGDEARWFQADNDNSSSRIRFVGSARLDEEWSAGSNMEVQFESNSSADVTIDQNTAVIANNSFTERKLELFFASKRFGKLTFGQGDTASNGSSEIDLSGTTLASKSELETLGKKIDFTLSGTRGTSADANVGDLFSNFDGLSRDDRLRYDTPSLGGARLSTSWVDGDEWDLALRYGRDFESTEVALAAAYWDAGPTSQFSGFSTSGSILLPFGSNLTLAYAERDREAAGRGAEDIFFAKLGQQLMASSLGKTAISLDYTRTDNQKANDNEGTAYSLAAVQKIDGLGAELFAVVRQYEANIANSPTEKITVGGLGARVKF